MIITSYYKFIYLPVFSFIFIGISYMTEPIETRLRENLTERQNRNNEKDIITIPEENRSHIESIW